MAVANLYLIGAPKTATTSLARWLSRHPDIFWSNPKEPNYWAADYPRVRARLGFETLENYEKLYASSEAQAARFRGDGSTQYLYSATAVPSIVSATPDARFVVGLRNPVDLLVSYHRTQLVSLNEVEPDFGRAWRRSLSGQFSEASLDPKLVDYPFVGKLGAALERLFSNVPRDRVHLVFFDEIITDPPTVWDELLRWLDLGTRFRPSFDPENVSNRMFRSRAVQQFVRRPPRSIQPAVRRIQRWTRTHDSAGVNLVRRHLWRTAARPAAFDKDRQAVADFLADDTARLSELVNRNLTGWTA